MWISPRRNSPTANPKDGRAINWALHPGRWLALALIFWVSFAVAVFAEGPVRVLRQEEMYAFSESLTFTLQVESDIPITDVILFYGREGIPLVRRIYPSFTPGTQVFIRHTEELERGQYAPGTVMRTWWQLELKDGTTFKTEVHTFEYTDDNQDWRTLSSEKAIIHYYGRSKPLAETLLQRAEESIARLQKEIGVSVERPVHIYLYENQQDMRVALPVRSEGFDSRVLTLGVAVSEDTLLLLGAHRDVEQTLAHEISHLIVGMATDNPYTDLPRWLDEGLAMYAEESLPLDNRRALERAIRDDRLLSIRSMSSYSGQAGQVDLFYGQAYSVVAFLLREYGREKMSALLEVFAQGSLQEEALRQVYGFGLDELDALWRQSLGLSPRRPVVTPTPAVPPLGNSLRQVWGALPSILFEGLIGKD